MTPPAVARTWADLAADRAEDGGLTQETDYVSGGPTFPFGAHLAVAEVDTETGKARLVRHVACDDAGIKYLLSKAVIEGTELKTASAGIPDRGLGVVTKVVDGARRASDVAMGAVLRHLGVLTDSDWQRLKAYCAPEVRNVAGKAVGVIRPCADPACARED